LHPQVLGKTRSAKVQDAFYHRIFRVPREFLAQPVSLPLVCVQVDRLRIVGRPAPSLGSAHIATLPVGDSNPYRPVRRTPSSWCERNSGSSVRHHTGAGWSSDHYRRPVVGLPGDALPFLNLLPVRRLPSPTVDLPSAHHCAHQPRDIVRFLERGGDVLRCPHRTTNGCVHQ